MVDAVVIASIVFAFSFLSGVVISAISKHSENKARRKDLLFQQSFEHAKKADELALKLYELRKSQNKTLILAPLWINQVNYFKLLNQLDKKNDLELSDIDDILCDDRVYRKYLFEHQNDYKNHDDIS